MPRGYMTCRGCGELKPYRAFGTLGRGTRNDRCPACWKAYKAHRAEARKG